jgi:hypothetical protein
MSMRTHHTDNFRARYKAGRQHLYTQICIDLKYAKKKEQAVDEKGYRCEK